MHSCQDMTRIDFLCSPLTGASCISELVWAWAWVVWQPGSPLASWATQVWGALPSSLGFSWAWSWSWSLPRSWGFTGLSWPSSYLQNKCLHQTPSHSFHSKAARTNRRFSPTSITPRGSDRMGWQQKHVGGRLDSCALSRCDLSILFKAIQLCQVSCIKNGHEDVLVVVGWCVDSLLDLLSDLNLYSDPESLHPLCKCSNQSVLWVWVSTFIPLPTPPPWVLFLLVVLIILCFETAEESCTLVFYFFMFFSGTIFWSQWWGTDKTYFFSLFMESYEDFAEAV